MRSKCVDIDITYDYLQESLEMFTVMITAIEPSSYLLLNPSRADVTIVDVKRKSDQFDGVCIIIV